MQTGHYFRRYTKNSSTLLTSTKINANHIDFVPQLLALTHLSNRFDTLYNYKIIMKDNYSSSLAEIDLSI